MWAVRKASIGIAVCAMSLGSLYSAPPDSARIYRVPASQGRANTITETIRFNEGQQTYPLQHRWIDSSSVSIIWQSEPLPAQFYSVETVEGTLILHDFPADSGHINLTYSYFPVNVPTQFQLHPDPVLLPILLRDSVSVREEAKETKRPTDRQQPYSGSANLISHGSIFRELNLSTGKGVALNSGLRMQLDGTIGDNIGVTAALTDQSTPLQPEGTTQRLDELDRVFINLDHPHGQATFGDFTTNIKVGEYGRFSRKLEGATVAGNYANQEASLLGAISKGQYRTQQIQGREGNQGPYLLRGRSGNNDIVVLAGTETVWLDGEQLTRGANQDYTIDYSTGELTFTPRNVITGESRIIVDFQYADFQYSRSIYAGQFTSNLWNENLKIRGMFASESDDSDNPLNPVINPNIRDSLSTMGDGAGDLRVSSVTPDTTGNYVRIDSNGVSIYEYVGEGLGDYAILFSRDSYGNYIRTSTASGQFYYEYNPSSGQVKYSPTVQVQSPRSHQMQSVQVEVTPGDRLRFATEMSATQFDANTFSGLDDGDNAGFAGRANGEFTLFNWGDQNDNNGLNLYGEFQQRNRRFNPIDRTNTVEFNREWNISRQTTAADEERSNIGFSVIDNRYVNSRIEWSQLKRGGNVLSSRNHQQIQGRYGWLESLSFNRDFADATGDTRESQTARMQVGENWWHPFVNWEFQEFTGDSSVVMRQPGGGVTFTGESGSQATIGYKTSEIEERPDTLEHRLPKSVGNTASLSGQWQFSRRLNTQWEIAHRSRDYSNYFEQNFGLQDTRYLLADWTGSLRDVDLSVFRFGYNWNTLWKKEQITKREYRYIQVEQGLGEYSYDTTFADYFPDPEGDYILRIVPGNDYEPVTSVQLGNEIRINPPRGQQDTSETWFRKIVSNIRSVTRWRYEEKTNLDNPEFNFRWQAFSRPDSGLVQGFQLLQEELYLFPTSPLYAIRYRYRREANVNGLDVRGTELQSTREHNLRWRATHFRPWTIELILEDKILTRESLFQTLRNRDIRERSGEGVFGYHPTPPHVFRTSILLVTNTGSAAQRELDIVLNEVTEEYTYQISNKGRLTAELKWISVRSKSEEADLRFLPYEVARGNQIGTTWEWRLNADYRINKYLTFRLQYQGRDEPHRATVYHQGSGEFRAVF